jgi:peptidoglycan-associated lipoprotein
MIRTLVSCLLLSALLSACGSKPKQQESTVVEDRSAATSGTQAYGAGRDAGSALEELSDPRSPLSVRVIYFDYDSSDIRSEFHATIEAHSAFLTANPNVSVVLEGHTDERGSREYNLALGERRALSVKRQMVLLGAASSQIRTTSYGEERPVALGSSESAWSQNRRVEIIY